MEQITNNQLPKRAFEALADIPPVPVYLYGAIMRKIDRRRMLVRAVFSVAASVLIAVSAFTVTTYRISTQRASYAPEVAEELQGVNNYINNDVYRENANSYGYYDEVLYQE